MHTWLLALVVAAAALAVTVAQLGSVEVVTYNDVCTPGDGATFEAYCDGETRDTTTAMVIVRGVEQDTCGSYGFPASCQGTAAIRVSYTLRVDEANHRGCTIGFDWGVVPVRGEDRICDPTKCATDKSQSPVCQRIQPLRVDIDVPGSVHEVPLVAEQFSPFEYMTMVQGEHFPQRKNHAPVYGDTRRVPLFENFINDLQGPNADGLNVDNDDTDRIPVWSVIDPNYESAFDDAFYCGIGSQKDVSGRRQCCFRGRQFVADDDDGDSTNAQQNLDYGRINAAQSKRSPAILDFCMANTDAVYGPNAFAWSKADESAGSVPSVYKCSVGTRCRSEAGFFPTTNPYDSLLQYFDTGNYDLATVDDRVADSEDDQEVLESTLYEAQIAGMLRQGRDFDDIADDDGDRRRFRISLRETYKMTRVRINMDDTYGPPAYNFQKKIDTELYQKLLLRDAKNVDTEEESLNAVNGTWVTLSLDGSGGNPKARRLRCGYCGSSPTLLAKASCPTERGKIAPGEGDSFLPCPPGDVSQSCASLGQVNYDPELFSQRCDDDGDRIRWSEIRHPRAYAVSRWFLGMSPVCAAMKSNAKSIRVHQKVRMRVVRRNVPDGGMASQVEVDLDYSDAKVRAGQSSASQSLLADISPETSDVSQLTVATTGAAMSADERVVVCDSALYKQQSLYDKDRFAEIASSDPYANPFDAIKNPAVLDETLGTCAGCTTMQQFLAEDAEEPNELLLWYHMSQKETSESWRSMLGFDATRADRALDSYKDIVRGWCGKAGVGMELFAVDGCDALSSSEFNEPEPGSDLIMPGESSTCTGRYETSDTPSSDSQFSCASKVPYVMPDALACSDRLPRLCAPTTNAPAGKAKRMVQEAADAAASINSPTGPTSFNDVSYSHHGFPEGTDLDRPNVWLGLATGTTTQRALFSTNRRSTSAQARASAWRESVVNAYLTGMFVVVEQPLFPCIYSIVYPSCQLASESDNGAVADGTFNTRLADTVAVASFVPREYEYSMYMGDRVACRLRVASATPSDYVNTLALTVDNPKTVVEIQFQCTLLDNTRPIASDETGYLLVRADQSPLFSVPIMSCDTQSAFVASFGPEETNVLYTPRYPTGEQDPCNSISQARSGRRGVSDNLPLVVVGDDIPVTEPAVPVATTTPVPTPTPTPTTDPTAEVGEMEDDEDADQPVPNPRSPSPSPTPSATANAIPTPTPEVDDDTTPDPEGENTTLLVVGVIAAIVVLCIGLTCCTCCIVQSSKKSKAKTQQELNQRQSQTAALVHNQ